MGTNAFRRLRLLLPPPTGRSPSLDEGGLGFRASSQSLVYNPGCRVATLLVSMGVMGFLGDLRGRNSKSPPNPLGLAERVHRPQTMIPPRSPTPHFSCEFGFFLHMHHMPRMPKAYDVFLQKPSGVLPENVEIIGIGIDFCLSGLVRLLQNPLVHKDRHHF